MYMLHIAVNHDQSTYDKKKRVQEHRFVFYSPDSYKSKLLYSVQYLSYLDIFV